MELATASLQLKGLAVTLWLHTDVDPPKDEWNVILDRLVADTKGIPTNQMRHFVISDGGAPGASQRARMQKELYRDQPMRLAVITTVLNNPIKRGIATALSWANPEIRFFMPAQAEQALRHVDLANEVGTMWAQYMELQSKLRPVKVLDSVANALHVPPPKRAKK